MDEKTKNMMPAKNEEDSIEKEVEYCERLLKTIEGMPVVPNLPRIIEKMNRLKETLEDTVVAGVKLPKNAGEKFPLLGI